MDVQRMRRQSKEKFKLVVSAESEQLIYQFMSHLYCSPEKVTIRKEYVVQYHGNLKIDDKYELEIVGIKAGSYLEMNPKNKNHCGLLVVIDCSVISSYEELKKLLRPFLIYLKSYSCVIGLVNSCDEIIKSLKGLLHSIDVVVPVFELDYTENNAMECLETLLYLTKPKIGD